MIFLSLAVVLVSPGLDKYVIVPVTVALPFPTAVSVHPVFAPLDTFTTFSLLLAHVIFVIILPASVNVAVRPIAFALLIDVYKRQDPYPHQKFHRTLYILHGNDFSM